MLFARFSKLNARFARLRGKSMKSPATKYWMTQLAFWMLIYIVIQFRTNLNERYVNLDAKFTKLGGKTYISIIIIIIFFFFGGGGGGRRCALLFRSQS